MVTLSTMNGDDVCPMPKVFAFVKSMFPENCMVPPNVLGLMMLLEIDMSPGSQRTPLLAENIFVDGCHTTF